jgi:hypothetical protein
LDPREGLERHLVEVGHEPRIEDHGLFRRVICSSSAAIHSLDGMIGFYSRPPFGMGALALQTDAECRRFDPWRRWDDGRRVPRGTSWRGDLVFVDPGGEGFGEDCEVAAGVAEVVGGVDECGGEPGPSKARGTTKSFATRLM